MSEIIYDMEYFVNMFKKLPPAELKDLLDNVKMKLDETKKELDEKNEELDEAKKRTKRSKNEFRTSYRSG